ncbi:MAG: excinuclease ABC subunit UvrC [Candidatus Omnitrophota bacterium]
MSLVSLKKDLEAVSFAPGVYLLRSERGEVLYVGKAKSLKVRLRSYFAAQQPHPKIAVLMQKVRKIETIETATEVDALLLEAQLIRKFRPFYNQELKDDKSYPLIKITGEKYPRVHVSRNKTDKEATYYGPFTDAKLLREAIQLIHTIFPIRKCRRLPKTACLYYHIGQCLGPCIRPEIEKSYQRLIREIRVFLGGGKKNFLDYLTECMRSAAAEYRFEDAQYFKGQIEALSRLKKKKFSFSDEGRGIVLSATAELKTILGFERLPEKIVCFDVSNVQGKHAVASKVSFYRELADKLEYRRYRIRGVRGINDYAMIQEALRRMLIGIREGREYFVPDIILIDGGLGQLSAAAKILDQEGFEDIRLLALAKRFEIVYDRQSKRPVPFSPDSPALRLFQKIRDEAHRFAVNYHRHLRSEAMLRSALDLVPGIGAHRKRVLYRQFGSLEEIRRSGVEQLARIPGMDRKTAENIIRFFKANPVF